MPSSKKRVAPAEADYSALSPPIRDAYERGRKDERASRKRHPFIMAGLMVLAAAGASLITLAAVTGSFGEGGAVADTRLAEAADNAAPVVDQAITRTQEAARDAFGNRPR
jgi:hypothetical protein